jgi:hypothetical protein
MSYDIDYEIPVTNSDIMSEIGNLSTMSSKIRYLAQKGYTRSEISKKLNIRYQWVRNVLITPIKS